MTVSSIYWTEYSTGAILCCNSEGGDLTTILSGLGSPRAIAVDNVHGKIYYSEFDPDTISRCSLSGTDIEVLVEGEDTCQVVKLDVPTGKFYYGSNHYTDARIGRASLNGSNREDLVTGVGPYGLGLDLINGKMYWTDAKASPNKVSRANLDGSSVEDIAADVPYGWGVDVDVVNEKVYWAVASSPSGITRANFDGTEAETIITSEAHAFVHVAVDSEGSKLYYSRGLGEGGTDLRRSDLDGQNEETVLANIGVLGGFTLVFPLAPSTSRRWDQQIYPLLRTTKRKRVL